MFFVSGESKALSLLDGYHESLVQNLLARVLRQIDLVEAGVTARQSHDVLRLDLCNRELLRASHADQSSEAVERHLRAARHELQELCSI